ncbi:MAG: cytochrome-c peroxidase [Deltaproteobacteria bacterium]|nr:cytochrome-c peroxidase [Deltaproteobacteria bacterium]
MKKVVTVVTAIIFFGATASFAAVPDPVMQQAQALFKPIPKTPPALDHNPVTPEKIALGAMLYFDPRLSRSGLISCNTCHNLGLGGADFQETSTGHKWQKGGRNSPTVLNSVFNIAQFWDGRATDLMQQAKGPVQASVEMSNTPEQVVKTLASMPEYVAAFKKAFEAETNPLTFDTMAKAIEAFEATLLTPDSPFDKFLKGDEKALTARDKDGLQLFMNKGCASCHGGINMGGTGYFPFGVVEKPKTEITAGDTGRFKLTGSESDQYVFKSPSLRNIELTTPYFHSGKVWCLKEATGIMGSAQLGITLSKDEIEKIADFLKTTTGVQPRVEHPILPAPTKDTPLPKLD